MTVKVVMLMNSSTERNLFIDMAKGVAVFLMLWGHCIQYCGGTNPVDFFGNPVFKTIYTFHMPLFALISGYLFFFSFSKRNLKELCIGRAKALLQPILFCAVFSFLLVDVLLGLKAGDTSPFFTDKWTEYLSSLWFLWSILAASVSVAILYKKCDHWVGRLLLLPLFMLLIRALPNGVHNQFIFPFFVAGFLYAKYKERIPTYIHALRYAAIPLFPLMLCFYENKHYIYTTGLFSPSFTDTQMMGINLYRWGIGLVGSVFALVILHGLYRFARAKLHRTVLLDGLAAMGKDSLAIYALSVPLLSYYLPIVFPKVLALLQRDDLLVHNLYVYTFGVTLLVAALYSFGLYWLIQLLKKIRVYPVLFG